MRRHLPRLSLLAGVALMLTACQAPPPVSLQKKTASYSVTLNLDSPTLGQRTATIQLSGPEPSRVVVAPSMRTMKMTGADAVATKVGNGRYQARGDFFPMLGDWNLEVRISGPTGLEVATFETEVKS
ncbi:MAG: hypothetical protein J2P15_16795 [Micromonosporaceae bacterium]|nr:hypothetical protein [Micromonosporaceae bacterium]